MLLATKGRQLMILPNIPFMLFGVLGFWDFLQYEHFIVIAL
jgi:hypothetical protein